MKILHNSVSFIDGCLIVRLIGEGFLAVLLVKVALPLFSNSHIN